MELLERQAELKILHAAFERANDGSGSIVLLSGEAGIGKTSLLRVFTEEIGNAARTYFGTCENLLSPRPLGPFRDIVRDSEGTFDRLSPDADRETYIDAFLRELRLAGRPALLIIDDAQWADDASLDVLRYLGRRIDDLPATICVSYRPTSAIAGHALPQVVGSFIGDSTIRVELGGLSDATVAAAALDAGRDADQLVAAVGGNPFYLAEALAAPDTSVPPTVRDTTAAHLNNLAPPARQLVEVLSQMPHGAVWESIEELVGPTVIDAMHDTGGFIDVIDGRLRFRHDLAQRAVEESLTETRRVHLNRTILTHLEHTECELPILVHHAVAAHDHLAVARYAPDAATEASAAGAFREAVRLCELALEHRELFDNSTIAQLHSTAAQASYTSNEFGAAATHADVAERLLRVAGSSPREHGSACVRASRMHTMTGDPEGARRLAMRAVEVLTPLPPGPTLALAYSTMGCLETLESRNREAVDWCTKAITLAQQFDEQATLAHALIYLGMARVGLGDDSGLGDVKRAIEIADRLGHAEYLFRASANVGVMLIWAGRHDEALPYVQMSLRIAADHNMAWALFHGRSQEANIDIFLGRLDRAEGRLRELLDTEEDPGAIVALPLALLGRILTRRGDPEGEALVEQAWQVAAASGESFRIATAGLARIEAAWLANDPEVVQELADEMVNISTAYNLRYFHGEVLRYLKRAGNDVEPFAGCPPALAAGIVGDWQRSAELWARSGNRYEEALELVEAPDPEAAFRGLRVLDELGAARAAALARQRLRDRGVTGVPRGPRADTRQNEAGLTRRQLDVLRHLADDRSNTEIADALFVSPRTVEHHVAAICTKLDVGSRGDAVQEAIARGVLTAES